MSENKKFNIGFNEGNLEFSVDLNQDGQKFLVGKVLLNEAIEEAIKRGDAIEGAKVVELGFKDGKMKLSLDTDKDGEKLLELEIDLAEGFDEAVGMFKK